MLAQLLLVAICLTSVLADESNFIVGGNDVKYAGEWPWQAALYRWGSLSCGASLISQDWLITAAHCVTGTPDMYSIVLGMYDRREMRLGEPTWFKIDKIIQHPSYEANSVGVPNDIALLRLETPASFSYYIAPVSLPEVDQDFVGGDCWITGWGKTSGSSGLADILQESNIDVYDQTYCSRYLSTLGDYHVCVGKQHKSGVCNGDSGGPLQCYVDGQWKLVGAASFMIGNCHVSYPSFYARVSYFRPWIKEQTGI